MPDHLLTDADIATHLAVGERWVAEQAKSGRFPHLKMGRKRRYTPAHLEEIVHICEQRPHEPSPQPRRARTTTSTTRDERAPLRRKSPHRLRSTP